MYDEKIYYFFMKVGPGNRFLVKAEEWGGLWVGYSDKINIIDNDNYDSIHIFDIVYLNIFSKEKYRNKTRIITFSNDKLIVWKITGKLTLIDEQFRNINYDRKDFETFYIKNHPDWDKSLHNQDKTFKKKESYLHSDLRNSKILPVKKVYEVNRSNLIAPIDSLSVYQYLNRGTFRPIFNAGKDKNMSSILDKYDSLEPIYFKKKISKDNNKIKKYEIKETDFGKFIRLYLNNYIPHLHKNGSIEGFKDYPFSKLSNHEMYLLIQYILNPAQVETLAALFVMDLNLTIDLFAGKGLDVVDIKGSCRNYNKSEIEKILYHVIDILKSLNVILTDDFINDFQESKTLRIQCKASSNKEIENNKILLFKPGYNNKKTNKNTLYINILLKSVEKYPDIYPNIKKWFDLMMFDLGFNH